MVNRSSLLSSKVKVKLNHLLSKVRERLNHLLSKKSPLKLIKVITWVQKNQGDNVLLFLINF